MVLRPEVGLGHGFPDQNDDREDAQRGSQGDHKAIESGDHDRENPVFSSQQEEAGGDVEG
jgi:hypothetical protein